MSKHMSSENIIRSPAGYVTFMTPIDLGQPGGASTNDREALLCIASVLPVLVVCLRQVYPRKNRINDSGKIRSIQIPYLNVRGILILQTCLFALICSLLILVLKITRSCTVFIVRNALVASILTIPARMIGAIILYRVLSVPYSSKETRLRSKRLSLPFRFLDITALRNADHVIAATDEACFNLRWKTNVHKIPFSVSPRFFSSRRVVRHSVEGSFHRTLSIGYVGRFNALYDFREFLKAVRTLAVLGNIRLKLVGDGPRKAETVSLARSLNLIVSLEIHEAIDPEKVPSLLETMDVLVNPQVQEHGGLSIKVLEAMAAGLVVITTVRSPEFGQPGVSYFLVRNRTEDFVRVISRLLLDQRLQSEVSKSAREHALQFAREVAAARWHQVLTQVGFLPE